jgi:hypothetical protein
VDGKINYNSSLLGDLEPYAYGEPGYLSSQTAYLNIPHKIQKIAPSLFLPEPDGTGSFKLNHAIDDGDIAFTMRLDRHSEIVSGLSSKSLHRSGLGTAIDPMINLCTLNYLLAGIQVCTQLPALRGKWDALLHYLDKKKFAGNASRNYNYNDLKHIVRHLIRPFGIAHGSEKQGGQHEGSLAPVQWPVSFVISLTLDGKEANMVNVWHSMDLNAGDDLVLRLKRMPLPSNGRYTLNHFPKSLTDKVFSSNLLAQVAGVMHRPVTHVWQLVPDVFGLDVEDPLPANHGLANGFAPIADPDFSWQHEGYWHIARTQVQCRRYGYEEFYYNDLANNLRTGHVDVTFQPTFYAMPYFAPAHGGGASRVVNLIGESFSSGRDGAGKRGWTGSLRIERGFGSSGEAGLGAGIGSNSNGGEGVGSQNGAGVDSSDSLFKRIRCGFEADRGVRVAVPREDPQPSDSVHRFDDGWMLSVRRDDDGAFDGGYNGGFDGDFNGTADGSVGSGAGSVGRTNPLTIVSESGFGSGSLGLDEDIGNFDSAFDYGGGASAGAGSSAHDPVEKSSGVSLMSSVFSVPKPTLKSGKRPAARGKGVMGAVLGTDGSVTHEASRIL